LLIALTDTSQEETKSNVNIHRVNDTAGAILEYYPQYT